jgi:hypothetical protein
MPIFIFGGFFSKNSIAHVMCIALLEQALKLFFQVYFQPLSSNLELVSI